MPANDIFEVLMAVNNTHLNLSKIAFKNMNKHWIISNNFFDN